MKERQRWQAEEDAVLRAYVKQYGPKEWTLITQRTGRPLHRDPKSCLERWRNYLKPGIKKGSLTPEEQSLVVDLQAKYGNKWNKIAAELPGRTAKRLGKWWEVFKEKQHKLLLRRKNTHTRRHDGIASAVNPPEPGRYDHILDTFAEKYVQSSFFPAVTFPSPPLPPAYAALPAEPEPILSLGSAKAAIPTILPVWMSPKPNPPPPCEAATEEPEPVLSLGSAGPEIPIILPVWRNPPPPCPAATSSSPAMFPEAPEPILSLGSANLAGPTSLPAWMSPAPPCAADASSPELLATAVRYCIAVEEEREGWDRHRREAAWRMRRLEERLEAEAARKRREEEVAMEAKVRRLREEEVRFVDMIESEYREELRAVRREEEEKEGLLMEAWRVGHVKLGKVVDRIGNGGLTTGNY